MGILIGDGHLYFLVLKRAFESLALGDGHKDFSLPSSPPLKDLQK